MAEDRDHILRDTEQDTYGDRAKRRGEMMRKEEDWAEAEEGPIYPTAPEEPQTEEERLRRIEHKRKKGQPGKKAI